MERLTEWVGENEDRIAIPKMNLRNNGHRRCMIKLAEYEDLEEKGLLLKLPCKVGDIVYVVEIDNDESTKDDLRWKISEKEFTLSYLDYINEGVFLTRTAAEDALKR